MLFKHNNYMSCFLSVIFAKYYVSEAWQLKMSRFTSMTLIKTSTDRTHNNMNIWTAVVPQICFEMVE